MTDGGEPLWITKEWLTIIHELQVSIHGGLPGVADHHLLDRALARPQHVYHYETQDLVVIAATYGHSIAKNHGFADGNKRTALVCALHFLDLNGLPCEVDQAEAVVMVEGLASGDVDRDALAGWLRKAE